MPARALRKRSGAALELTTPAPKRGPGRPRKTALSPTDDCAPLAGAAMVATGSPDERRSSFPILRPAVD